VIEYGEQEEENTPRSATGMIPARRRASPRSLNSPLNVEADSIRSSKRRAVEKAMPDKPINEVIAHPHAC
jgi:hypothetical protein